MILPTDIITIVQTKDAANQFHSEIEELLGALFSHHDFSSLFKEQFTHDSMIKIQALFQKYHINPRDISQTQTFLGELKKGIEQLPVVTLTLAFSPKQQFVEMLSTWFMLHVKEMVLLEILVDKQLIGGAIISCNGKYKDYSVKKILQEKYAAGDLRLTI